MTRRALALVACWGGSGLCSAGAIGCFLFGAPLVGASLLVGSWALYVGGLTL